MTKLWVIESRCDGVTGVRHDETDSAPSRRAGSTAAYP
jgi:hypothetical protein